MAMTQKFAVLCICMAMQAMTAMPANAQMNYFHISSGTGFYVNRQYLITNAHVVRNCDSLTVKGAVPEEPAVIRVIDEQNDLALLATQQAPNQFAPLRFNIETLAPQDSVFIIGYPGEAGARGEYHVAEAEVKELKLNEGDNTGHFYISDVLDHGNSGGPVFDTSGNVIGVVVAKTELFTIDAQTKQQISSQKVGVAITLETLKKFLFDHGIYTQWTGSGQLYAKNYLESRTRNYIVNVQCKTDTDANGNPLRRR